MNVIAFRIISIIVLIAVVSIFTDLATTVSAVHAVKSEKAIGNHCNSDEECPIPCSTPVCISCICMVADAVVPIDVQVNSLITEFLFPYTPKPIPDPFVTSIFHPPLIVI